MDNKGNHPQMALFQVSDFFLNPDEYMYIYDIFLYVY